MDRKEPFLKQAGIHIFLFCLFFVLLSWPVLFIPGSSGLQSMFSYLFCCWALIIGFAALICRALKDNSESTGRLEKGRDSDV